MGAITLTTADRSAGQTIMASHINLINDDLEGLNDHIPYLGLGMGTGADGTFTLGTISGTPSAPTIASVATSGNLTGTFTYKISAYNESGHTIASSASSSTGAITAKRVDLTLPAMPSNGKGWKIFRSTDSVTWYFVGRSVGTGTTYYDNCPAKSTATAPGSNTTATTATLSGEYHFSGDVSISGDITVNTSGDRAGTLIIRATGKVTVAAAISANGAYTEYVGPVFGPGSTSSYGKASKGGDGGAAGTNPAYGRGFAKSLKGLGFQGGGGDGAAAAYGGTGGTGSAPGGTIAIIAKEIDVTSAGSITANGAVGGDASTAGAGAAGGGGGGAGGCVILLAYNWIRLQSSSTVTANGANGGNAAGSGGASTAKGGGGGGGGYILALAPVVEMSGTIAANAGSAGSNNTSANSTNGGGGGGGGSSGDGGEHTGGNAASAGNVLSDIAYFGNHINFLAA